MKNTMMNLLLTASLVMLAAAAVAQDRAAPADTKAPAHKPTILHAKKYQQKRIAHGVQSGKLTAGEAASLEKKEAGLNADERDMREDNRGRLTTANRAKLRHQHKQVSKAVYKDKHNATVAKAHVGTAGGKRATTQHPAGAQLKTGQLTARQAAHLETKETSLRRDIHSDREETGHRTKSADGDQTNEQQNKTTNPIRLKKHNARMF